MELLCPTCQRKLTIPDQYAGQLMKCPLCQATFTAPALPATPGPAFMAPAPAPPPPAPPPPASQLPAPAFEMVQDTAAWHAPMVSEPLPELHPMDSPPAPPAPPPPPGEYTTFLSVFFSPKILQWVPGPAVFLVFVLTFFPWFSFAPGGVGVNWQSPWQALFGQYSTDADLEKLSPFKDSNFSLAGPSVRAEEPGWGAVLTFYLLCLFLALALNAGATVLGFLHQGLPPFVELLRPWRWVIAGGGTLLMFLFLLLNIVIGFNMENKIRDATNTALVAGSANRASLPIHEQAQAHKMDAMVRGLVDQALARTLWFKIAFALQVLAILISALLFWLDFRRNTPLPRVDIIF